MAAQEELEVRDQLYERFAQIGKALGSARRLQLLELLAQAEYAVEKLAEEAEMSVANTSQHLKILRAAHLVEVRREGVVAYYSLASEAVFPAWQAIRSLGESQLVEIDWLTRRLWPARSPTMTVPFAEASRLRELHKLTLVDVRPFHEFQAGHIPGALSIPLVELPGRLAEIARDRAVAVYCRGPYSTLADKATALLLAYGYDAKRLELGFPEWRAAGLPCTQTAAEGQPARW